jgi:primosomal protein N' (replication factor Y)
MQRSARADTVEPTIDLVDMTKRGNFTRHPFLSNTLLEQLETTFAEGKQALIFHNRRGTASTTLCENCGWQSGCPRCYVPLTLHADQHTLRCHICDLKAPVPTSCPVCHHADIIHKGLGTKRIESELHKLFPDRTIARFDGDTASTDSVDQRYQDLYDGHINLIIGTQVIAKGLDLPHLRTVGVVQADAGLSLPDFGAPERTFQLLAQVIGRVGRSHHATQVVVQSYQPSHPAIQDGLTRNYADFYQRTLALRRHANFPPFCYLLKLVCVYKTEKSAVQNARKLASVLKQHAPSTVEVLGPTPAFYERVRDTYRWQLVIKSPRRQDLIDLLQHVPSAHWQFELDPTSLL